MKLEFLQIPSKTLFPSPEGRQFPRKITVLADLRPSQRPSQADIDVVIGSHHQAEAVNLTIENYSLLEREARLHFWVIESSFSAGEFQKIRRGENVSRVLILSPLRATNRRLTRVYYASNGAALAASLGACLGAAPCAFFSHSDMMGYKQNFLSFLATKISDKTVLASFTQRHVLPFTGGMLWEKKFFSSVSGDWLPKRENPYPFPAFAALRAEIPHLSWLDAGEQLVFEALAHGKTAHVCASRGVSGDYFGHPLGHPLEQYGVDVRGLESLGIHYAPLATDRTAFDREYPGLATAVPGWRKCFDDEGEVVFIHRGRGSRQRGRGKGWRGDFESFLQAFNQEILS